MINDAMNMDDRERGINSHQALDRSERSLIWVLNLTLVTDRWIAKGILSMKATYREKL